MGWLHLAYGCKGTAGGSVTATSIKGGARQLPRRFSVG